MCFPGYSKTCMPTVRQIIDCLVAARPMPIRCGPCLTAKCSNTATNNRDSNGVSSTANSNNIDNYINNNKNLHAYENIQSFSIRENIPIGCAINRDQNFCFCAVLGKFDKSFPYIESQFKFLLKFVRIEKISLLNNIFFLCSISRKTIILLIKYNINNFINKKFVFFFLSVSKSL